MSLAGFDHVFASAVEMHLAEGLRIRVVPAVVTVLLKIIAYMEDPHRRSKDLQDIRVVLARYEAQSDRLFSDAVFDAELPDFEVASAFLLGLDLRALATNDDAKYVMNFLMYFLRQEDEGYFDDDDFSTKAFRDQIRALNRGFAGDRSGSRRHGAESDFQWQETAPPSLGERPVTAFANRQIIQT